MTRNKLAPGETARERSGGAKRNASETKNNNQRCRQIEDMALNASQYSAGTVFVIVVFSSVLGILPLVSFVFLFRVWGFARPLSVTGSSILE